MADDNKNMGEDEAVALDLDGQTDDLDAAMRDAVAAVEGVEGERGRASVEETDEEEVAKLRREIADLRDRSMRTLADFDNFRKRSERERQETRKYALLEPLRDFLEIVDNLGLALAAAGSADDLKRGVEMIHRQMQELLRRLGVKEIEALNQPFDPALHEAVQREEDPTVQKPTVVGELRRGYMLHERLLRPTMVKVAVPSEGKPAVEGV
ncbi:MAG TPA: nucleotide exchange factor GrpE [Thermoanaerobaculia bacterium]|jgi:molecular chaperone GrpE|nr:nucleotide exchange factor GrpE [Thermoanaerobaculia bacterium]